MPINLQDIASISGMPGLYRIIRPTRNGVIVETLDEKQTRMVAQARQRLSLLQEISIYTTDEEETIPLADVMNTIEEKYGNELPVTAKSSGAELADFMEAVVPNYDADRVYASDMKKLVQWYNIAKVYASAAATQASETEASSNTEEEEVPAENETAVKKPKAAKKKKTADKE